MCTKDKEYLIDLLGAHWNLSGNSDSVETLHHSQLACDFVFVPGGVLRMGLVEQDCLPLKQHVEWDWVLEDRWRDLARICTPPRDVVVVPFLCAVTCVTEKTGDKKRLNLLRQQALETVANLGFRLLSEAEFEWIAREGSEVGFNSNLLHDFDRQDEIDNYWPDPRKLNQFGVRDLFIRQWVADDWHPNYEGAPLTSTAWHHGDPRGVLRGDDKAGSFELGTEVLLDQLAAARWPGDSKQHPFRLALDLPPEINFGE